MLEICIHGRGGQGAKTAAQFIVESAIEEGKYILAFPEYGPERTGAPMKSYVRIDDEPIRNYTPIINPDIVMVIDTTLIKTVCVTEGLDPKKGILLVNTNKKPEEIREMTGFEGQIYTVDGTAISLNNIGMNKPNTPLVGAFVKATKIIPLDILKQNIEHKFLKKLGKKLTEGNLKAVQEGYDKVQS